MTSLSRRTQILTWSLVVVQNYRAENFATAAGLYESLSKEDMELGNESNDLRINSWATDAQALWKREADLSQARRPAREDLEAFETTYNAACSSLARGDYTQSALLLKRAKGMLKRCSLLLNVLIKRFRIV